MISTSSTSTTSPTHATDDTVMECRPYCGACCIAPSITTPFFGMPSGKPAGVACIHLREDFNCSIFDSPHRPSFCRTLQPRLSLCADSQATALYTISLLEELTKPDVGKALDSTTIIPKKNPDEHLR